MKTIKTINVISVFLTAVFVICVIVAALTPDALSEWTYTLMGAQVNYSIGDRVTHMGHVYECVEWDEGDPRVIFPPTANPDWWAEVR